MKRAVQIAGTIIISLGLSLIGCTPAPSVEVDTPVPGATEEPAAVQLTQTAEAAEIRTIETILASEATPPAVTEPSQASSPPPTPSPALTPASQPTTVAAATSSPAEAPAATPVPIEVPTATTIPPTARRPAGKALLLIPVVESPHPYPNNYDESWLVSNLDADAAVTRLHVARLELEEGVDWLIIMDPQDVELQRLTGFYPDGIWTDPVPGNLVKLRLITDGSVQHWGFALDAVETVSYTSLAYSPHPYPNQANLKWQFNNLDVEAEGTRLHFSRVELEEGVDWLVIMDITEEPYQWITGHHPDGLWTMGVPGTGITVRLISDGSVNDWGFNLDALESVRPEEALFHPELEESLAESKHPYEEETVAWTLVNPNPGAAFTKVHFTRLDIDNGRLTLLDGGDNQAQVFWDDTHLPDFWSDDVPGRVVKAVLQGWGRKDWGFRIDQLVDGSPKASLAESKHPYEEETITWTLVNPDPQAAFTKVHFSRLDIDNGRLTLLDGNDNQAQVFWDDTHLHDVWSDDVLGRIVKVVLQGWGRKDWGFRIDQLAVGAPKASLAESKHPYEEETVTWTLVNPNPQAAFTEVHFTRLDIENGRLTLLDENDNEMQIFGDGTHERDFWSDDIPGRIVKVVFQGWGRKDWGFRINDIAPKVEEVPIPAFVNAIYIHVGQPGTLWLNGVELGRASTSGDYRIQLPEIGEHLITVETLFHQQQIIVRTSEDGEVQIEYGGIQPKSESDSE